MTNSPPRALFPDQRQDRPRRVRPRHPLRDRPGTRQSVAASLFVCLAGVAAAQDAKPAPAPAAPSIEQAVAEMRHVARDLPEDEARPKADRIDAAWKTLVAAKAAGAKALLDEIVRVDQGAESDDYFKLGAAVVLWKQDGLARAGDIAAIWKRADLTANYNYVFYTAFEAAGSGDERALPMLLATLHDQKGRVFLERHAFDVVWPLSHQFLFGPLGSKALPAVVAALAKEKDPVALASAITVASLTCHLPALERIRQIAKEGQGDAQQRALQALGRFGHPADFDLLVAGLRGADAQIAWSCAFGLYEYEDLRAVPHLIALAKSPDEHLRREVLAALGHLATVDGYEALAERLQAKDVAVPGVFEKEVMPGFRELDLKWKVYSTQTPAERGAALGKVRALREADCVLQPDDRKLSHDDFVRAAQDWIKRTRITEGEFAWVEKRHVLAAATAADLPLLQDVRGALFRRLSNECLDEVKVLDGILRRVLRAQYRRQPGLAEKVELPAASRPGRK